FDLAAQRGELDLDPFAAGGDVGHPATHAREQLRLRAIGLVEPVAQIVDVESVAARPLGPEQTRDARQESAFCHVPHPNRAVPRWNAPCRVAHVNDAADQTPQGKGGPTRSRKEAEAARKQQMKRPLTRKEQAQRDRRRRAAARDKQREALMGSGSAADLPPRDRGPARALARDAVDRRRTVAEFMLPILVVILVLSFFPAMAPAVFTVWTVTILATVVDELWLVVSLRRELAKRFT